jgi:hypothetical protein
MPTLKTLLLSVLLVIGLALSASASSIDVLTPSVTTLPCPTCGGKYVYTNSGGTLTYSNGFTLTGSTLVAVFGRGGGLVTGNLGTVTFTTPPLLTGNIQSGGTFGTGGKLIVRANGNGGFPAGSMLFNSYFGGGSWTMETLPDGTHQYVLADQVGPFRSVQITLNTGTGFFTGSVGLAGGVTAVPEPATLAFVGTGLAAIAALRRKKFISS